MEKQTFFISQYTELVTEMAVGVILFTFVKANHDTDHFHPNLNQIVRILTQEINGVEQTKWATAPLPLATQIESVSFVEKTVKVRLAGKYNLQSYRGDVPIDIKFSEPSFFDVFGFKLLSGNAQSLTNNPTTLFLTEKTANLYNLKDGYSGEGSRERIGFFGFFALIVMIIAGLGILGIASYSVEIRTKELGIKKVLGASTIRAGQVEPVRVLKAV